jgi:hypothetical protein
MQRMMRDTSGPYRGTLYPTSWVRRGQHAWAVADALGMTSVLIHPLAGALPAYGIAGWPT